MSTMSFETPVRATAAPCVGLNSRAAALLSLERLHQVSLVPVGRKPVLAGELAAELKRQVLQLADLSGYRVISLALRPDRFDVLLELSGLNRRESVTRELRGLTSLRLMQAFPWIRVKLKSNHLWD